MQREQPHEELNPSYREAWRTHNSELTKGLVLVAAGVAFITAAILMGWL